MAEYASKGLSNGIGIPALVLGSLGFLQSGGLGNGLGGLFGNNQQQERVAALMAENTQLKSQVYTDGQVKDLNAEICGLRQEVTKQGAEIECINRTSALREEIVDGKIARVADAATCGINTLKCSLDCLQQTVAGITRTYVPAGAVTPLPSPWPYPPVPPYFPPIPPAEVQQASSSSSSTTGA